MQHLTRAHEQLFRRAADERFDSLAALTDYCNQQRASGEELWLSPDALRAAPLDASELGLYFSGSDGAALTLNDWSFGQLCRLAGVAKETVNRLSADTGSRVLGEMLPGRGKPLHVFTHQKRLARSIHPASYTRLFNTEVLEVVEEFATDFEPPQQAAGGGTGLYCGEQDMFCFLIDPLGWTEIEGEAFAPGFFVWNSEVGRRSVGIQTFWFQAVCQNHIVWDAVQVVEFSRRHTVNVRDALNDIRSAIETLVAGRDKRRDGFSKAIRRAMTMQLGEDAEEAMKSLSSHAIPRSLAKKALEIAKRQGAFTIFAVVDALTRLTGEIRFAGDRAELDQKVAGLLALAS